MAALSHNDIARSIYLATKDKTDAEQSVILKRTVELLARKGLLSKAQVILGSLKKIINSEEGVVEARVSSPEKLSERSKTEIWQALSRRYSGKTVSIVENIDTSLLGGIKIEVDDEVIDLSMKNRINKLQECLTTQR